MDLEERDMSELQRVIELFCHYDLQTEVARRLSYARHLIFSDWQGYLSATKEDRILSLDFDTELDPLSLDVDAAVLERVDDGFEMSIPFGGDDELWRCYPYKPIIGVCGQLFRGRLILGAETSDETAAQEQFDDTIRRIEVVIGQIADQIRHLKQAMPHLLKVEYEKCLSVQTSRFAGIVIEE